MAESNNIIGNNIKRFRERLDLSQEMLANYLGLTHAAISQYENGHRVVPSDVILKIAGLFGIDGYDLYEENILDQRVNVAFAFRADALSTGDLQQISMFRKVVRNYLQMKKVIEREYISK